MDWETNWVCWLQWTRPDQKVGVWHSLWNGCKHSCRTTALQLRRSCRKNPKFQKFFSWCCFLASWCHCILPSERVSILFFIVFYPSLSLSFYTRIKIMQEIEWESLDFLFFCFSLKYYPISCFLTFHFVHYKAFFLNVCDWRLLGSTSCLSLLFSKQEFSFHLSYNCH